MSVDSERYLIVARIVAPFGIKGEVKADLLTDFPARLTTRKKVYLGREGETPRMYLLRGVRFHQGQALLTLSGCDDRNTAETMRGLFVHVPASEAPPPPAGSYYIDQIVGLQVLDVDGAPKGTVTGVIETGSNHVYIVKGEAGELLVPAIPGFVVEIDLEHGRMTIDTSRL